jgi:hypothetical protein
VRRYTKGSAHVGQVSAGAGESGLDVIRGFAFGMASPSSQRDQMFVARSLGPMFRSTFFVCNRHHFSLLRLLFSRIRNDDAAGMLFLFLEMLDENAVTERPDIHEHAPRIFLK